MSMESEFLDQLQAALRPCPPLRYVEMDSDAGRAILFCSDAAGRTCDGGVLLIPDALLDE